MLCINRSEPRRRQYQPRLQMCSAWWVGADWSMSCIRRGRRLVSSFPFSFPFRFPCSFFLSFRFSLFGSSSLLPFISLPVFLVLLSFLSTLVMCYFSVRSLIQKSNQNQKQTQENTNKNKTANKEGVFIIEHAPTYKIELAIGSQGD